MIIYQHILYFIDENIKNKGNIEVRKISADELIPRHRRADMARAIHSVVFRSSANAQTKYNYWCVSEGVSDWRGVGKRGEYV